MAPAFRRLVSTGLVLVSLFAAVKLTPAQTQESLETKTEKLHYNISCSTKIKEFRPKIGDVEFVYERTGNNYTITTDVETTSRLLSILLKGKYLFVTTGDIAKDSTSESSFLPKSYSFTKKDRSGRNLVEVVQYFDFREGKVRSERWLNDRKKKDYEKKRDLDEYSRDIFSALMELRTRPLQTYTFQIIENGERKPFTFVYSGENSIMINNKRHEVYTFRVDDRYNLIIKQGQNVFIYLEKDAQRPLLRICMTDHDIGDIIVEMGGKKTGKPL